ncbi:LytS/YhcK type 5TM receptor domain-containing protein [Mycoplasma sp. P36-A1]|uniref:LytS/YhcK type 5TM receptor domain-containing protein n=1 Tax=Mycoplasma sp. P36-A1 TaxID=3252900 RepID=UPI003C30AF28
MDFAAVYTIVINLGLLVMAGQLMTRFKDFSYWLTKEKLAKNDIIPLALIFSILGICATIFGTQRMEGIVNTRSVVVFSGGLLFGPWVGIASGLAAGIHRYFYSPADLTAIACSISTLVVGIIGSFCYKRDFFPYRSKKVAIAMAIAGVIEGLLILLIARPFDQAVSFIVNSLSMMFILNCMGAVLLLSVFEQSILHVELYSSKKASHALRLAGRMMPFLRKGINDPVNISKALSIIEEDSDIKHTMIYSEKKTLIASAHKRYNVNYDIVDELLAKDTKRRNKKPFNLLHNEDNYVAATLYQDKEKIGYLVLILKNKSLTEESNNEFIRGLASIVSTQLELAEIDINKEKVKEAEYAMLQAQINPHFLFNILNTIISISRTDSDKSRKLLVDLSNYFRGVLKKPDQLIPLEEELENIEVYFTLEKARFGESIKLIINNKQDLNPKLPRFSIQPIVENAIKHGLRGLESGKIEVIINKNINDYIIIIKDNGKGMSKEKLEEITSNSRNTNSIGISNVSERLTNLYGKKYGLQVQSKVNEYTIVTMFIPIKED